jgi:dipeptidyl-peptidase-4
MRHPLLAAAILALVASPVTRPQDGPPANPAPYTIELMEGRTLRVSQRLVAEHPAETIRAKELLQNQLALINRAVPAKALDFLHGVPLWFSPRYPGNQPPRAEYHPNAQWLRENGRNPQMAKAVEFTNIEIFERETRRMPWFVLHELAHAFHDQTLGFDNPEIIAAYEQAVKSGRYDHVKRWTGAEEVTERAYAMTNYKEYFAEDTEAYFGRNDFQPFDRDELRQMDPAMCVLLERLWR